MSLTFFNQRTFFTSKSIFNVSGKDIFNNQSYHGGLIYAAETEVNYGNYS